MLTSISIGLRKRRTRIFFLDVGRQRSIGEECPLRVLRNEGINLVLPLPAGIGRAYSPGEWYNEIILSQGCSCRSIVRTKIPHQVLDSPAQMVDHFVFSNCESASSTASKESAPYGAEPRVDPRHVRRRGTSAGTGTDFSPPPSLRKREVYHRINHENSERAVRTLQGLPTTRTFCRQVFSRTVGC